MVFHVPTKLKTGLLALVERYPLRVSEGPGMPNHSPINVRPVVDGPLASTPLPRTASPVSDDTFVRRP